MSANSKAYVLFALKILKDCHIQLTEAEKEKLFAQKTEEAVDRLKKEYIRKYII